MTLITGFHTHKPTQIHTNTYTHNKEHKYRIRHKHKNVRFYNIMLLQQIIATVIQRPENYDLSSSSVFGVRFIDIVAVLFCFPLLYGTRY